MGDMSQSVNFHYSRKNLIALYRIAEDVTVDEEDRELAKEFIEKIEREDEEIDDTQNITKSE